MAKIKISSLKTFDAADFLERAESRIAFLDLALRSGDINDIIDSLNIVARSAGMQAARKPDSLAGQAAEKPFRVQRSPRLSDLLAVVREIGAELYIAPAKSNSSRTPRRRRRAATPP